jgi:hypothetical protein
LKFFDRLRHLDGSGSVGQQQEQSAIRQACREDRQQDTQEWVVIECPALVAFFYRLMDDVERRYCGHAYAAIKM